MRPISDRRVDGTQLRASSWLHNAVGLRPARDSTTGKTRGSPLVVLPAYLILGLASLPALGRCADLRTHLILVATGVLALAAFTLIPDALDQQQRRVEILGTKPIGEATQAVANALGGLRVLALVVPVLEGPPLAYAMSRHGASFSLILGFAAALLVVAFALHSLWIAILLRAAMSLSYDRVRSAAQIVLLFSLVAFWIPSFTLQLGRADDAPVSFAAHTWLVALPPAWVVDAILGPFDPITQLERLALVALIAGAVVVRVRMSRRDYSRRLFEAVLQPTARGASLPSPARLLAALERAWPGDVQARAVTKLVLLASSREDDLRLRRLTMQVFLLLTAIAVPLIGDLRLSLPPAITFSAMLLMVDLDLASQSHFAAASWILQATPVPPLAILRGLRLAVLLQFAISAWLPLAIAFFLTGPPVLAALLTAAAPVAAFAVCSLTIALRPALPLSREPRVGMQLLTTALSLLFGVAGVLLVTLLRAAPLVAAPLLVVAAIFTDRLARRSYLRLDR